MAGAHTCYAAGLVALLGGCVHGGEGAEPDNGPGQAASRPAGEGANPLRISIDDRDFSSNPKLLDRILEEPHGYFRFVNRQFSQLVCNRFRDLVRVLPSVNLHGDAHLEQYAVTGKGRGLTDFDDSTTGPSVIDLMRVGVSIALASEEEGWGHLSEPLFDRFLAGYLASLRDPEVQAPEPSVVTAVRDNFDDDPEKFFEWVLSVIEPLPADDLDELKTALEPYVERMVELDNDVSDPSYFEVRQAGLLNLGIGSALDEKYVLRVEGPSREPQDDVVLELKRVRDLRGVSCIEGTSRIDPFRILVAQSRIAYRPYEHLGYIRHQGQAFWIHSWVVNYRELDLPEMVKRPEQLEEILYDIGVQLGRGHPNQIAAPLDEELRAELLDFVLDYHDRLHVEIQVLTDQVREAYEDFVRQAQDRTLSDQGER